MLIELLSQANYESFNVKLAHVIGLNAAIHLSLLMDINEKAIRKEKTDGEYFSIDRKYITSRTTLKDSEQKDIETKLEKIGIVKRSTQKNNIIAIDLTTITSILSSPDEDLLKDISNLAQPKKRTKAEVISDNLKNAILTKDVRLRSAYEQWIDAVVAKDGFMTIIAVQHGEEVVNQFAGQNCDVALKVLESAATHAYREMIWAVNAYKKDYATDFSQYSTPTYQHQVLTTQQPQQQSSMTRIRVSDEVF